MGISEQLFCGVKASIASAKETIEHGVDPVNSGLPEALGQWLATRSPANIPEFWEQCTKAGLRLTQAQVREIHAAQADMGCGR